FEYPRGGQRLEPLQGGEDERLRRRPRDQDRRRDFERKQVKLSGADQVSYGAAVNATADQFAKPGPFRLRHFVGRTGVEANALAAQRVSEQHLSVQPRGFGALLGEELLRPVEQGGDGPDLRGRRNSN